MFAVYSASPKMRSGSLTPLVVYACMTDTRQADGLKVYDGHNAPATRRSHQSKPEEWAKIGITENSSIRDIKSTLDAHGIEWVTYDVLHAENTVDGHHFNDPVALAHKLASHDLVDAIHLSVNRMDMAARGSRLAKTTQNAEWAFSRGARQAKYTPEGEMIEAIAQQWNTNPLYNGMTTRVVLEEGPFGVHAAKSQAAMLATAREIVQR